jgi:hypothetical protein
MTVAILRHNECYRILAALSLLAVRFADRGCGVAIEQLPQYSTNRSIVAHVRDVCINWGGLFIAGPSGLIADGVMMKKPFARFKVKTPTPPGVGHISVVTNGPHGATSP